MRSSWAPTAPPRFRDARTQGALGSTTVNPDEAMAIDVSVVIPVRNGDATIAEQLDALSRQDFPGSWEVVVADNGSTDRTRAVVEGFFGRVPGLRVVEANDGAGINIARNAGVRAARGRFVLLCDADDVVAPGWVAALARALETDELAGGPVDERSLNAPGVAEFNERKERNGSPVCGRFLPYATGCNLGFRREAWDLIGGFDDAWRRGATEIEFCWRAQLAGLRLGWAPDAVVRYRHAPSIKSEFRRRYVAARALPRLFSQFARHGMPRRALKPAVLAWFWIVYRSPWAAVSSRWRMKWLQVAAWRAGLLAGSVRYRVLYI